MYMRSQRSQLGQGPSSANFVVDFSMDVDVDVDMKGFLYQRVQ